MDEQMKPTPVNYGVKNNKFYFVDNGMFVITTPNGQQNKICMFCEKITAIGRKYADDNTTVLDLPKAIYIKSDQEKYIGSKRIEYWHYLFNLGIWKHLEKDNEVTFMKRP